MKTLELFRFAGRRRCLARPLVLLTAVLLLFSGAINAQGLLPITDVDAQPVKAQARRLLEALDYVGNPLSSAERAALERAYDETDDEKALVAIQSVFNQHVINAVHINPESRVKVAPGPATPELVMQGWRVFLVRVHNEAGVRAELKVESPNAAPLYRRSTGSPEPEITISPGDVGNRWMDISLYNGQPLQPRLSGLELEYRIVEIYSRDS